MTTMCSVAAWCVMIVAVGCGGGGGDLGEDDCRAADFSCPLPFACIRCSDTTDCIDTQLGEYSCMSPQEGRPTCTEQPDGQVVPFATLGSGRTVHWAIKSGCIATSYDSGLSARADAIRVGLNAWENVSCSEICFDDPFETPLVPELREQRIHFAIDELEPEFLRVNAVTIAQFEIRPDTGRITNVLIRIRSTDDPNYDATVGLEDSDFIRLVGFALGLATPSEPSNSIMTDATVPRSIVALTPEDEAAVCSLYGTPSYCGD